MKERGRKSRMTTWILWGRGSIFWRNMGITLLITCIPTVIIGVLIYYVGTPRIETEMTRAHQNQLNLSIQQLNDYLTNLEHSVVRLAFDHDYDESLNEIDFIQEFAGTNELMKSFSLITESNSLIDSVILYLRDADKLIGDKYGFRSIQSDEYRKRLRSLLDREQTIYWDYSLPRFSVPESDNKAIILKLPGGQMYGSFGAFLIYLNQDKLNAMVKKLSFGQGTAFLYNENDVNLTPPQGNAIGPDKESLVGELKVQIKQNRFENNKFKLDWHKQTYIVSYGTISKLGSKWTIVSATPLSQVTAPVTSLSRLILWIGLLGLTIGLLLSWVASNKIYAPIQRLSTRLKQSIPALRESFLLQLLQGHLYTHTESELIDKMKQLEWDVEHKRFGIMVAQLHGVSELIGRFSERDEQLITFAASNIALELCSEKWSVVHVINFQDLSVGVLIVLDNHDTNEEMKASLHKLAHDYIATVNNVLRLRVTIVTSKITDSIVEVPKVLEQTRKALRFRNLHTSNQLLDMNQFMMETISQKQFPAELEREIVHTVSIGLEDEAVRLIRQFMVELQNNNSTEIMVHQGMMKLLGALHDMIIKHNVNLCGVYEGAHLYEQLMQLTEPDQIIDWFQYKLIRPCIKSLSIAYDSQLRELIDKLLLQIREDILKDISLEAYAEQLQMSSSKLSKVFRQISGTNFIDTIIRLRMEKCKELLVTTDLRVNDIAEMLHYQPSHLIRLFKKTDGITPRQYREKHVQQ